MKKTIWIVRTAVCLALLLVLQVATKSLGQFVTGSCVNLVLAMAALTGGVWSGVIVAVISPFCAYALGIGPAFLLFVPCVALGNAVYAVLFALLVGAVCVVVCLRRGTAAQLVPPCIVWGLGLAAPASWMVLSKAHAAIHTHLVPMLWHFAFVPISCMLLPVLAKLMIPGRKKDLVASH